MSAAPQKPMELSIRPVEMSDREYWDGYVSTHNAATPYHRFSWLQAVTEAYPQKNASLIAFNGLNKVVGVYPAILMNTPFSASSLCSLPYCDLGGSLTDSTIIHNELESALRTKFLTGKRSFLDVRASKLEIEPSTTLENKKVRMLLALPSSSEVLLASFKSKLRSQIKKAEKNGLTYELGNDTRLLNNFYQVYTRNMRDLGSPAHSKKWFESIANAYGAHLIISVVYKDTTPVGAGIVLSVSNKACIPWASTVKDYNRLAPNMLLYWSLLSYCADKGIRCFDFGRSTYEEGTYKFKKQWGAEPELLEWKQISPSGAVTFASESASTSKLRAHIEKLWRKLPVSLTIFIGARVRPYISL